MASASKPRLQLRLGLHELRLRTHVCVGGMGADGCTCRSYAYGSNGSLALVKFSLNFRGGTTDSCTHDKIIIIFIYLYRVYCGNLAIKLI